MDGKKIKIIFIKPDLPTSHGEKMSMSYDFTIVKRKVKSARYLEKQTYHLSKVQGQENWSIRHEGQKLQ